MFEGYHHVRLIPCIIAPTRRFFDTTPIGRIVNRFSGDQICVDNDLARNFNFVVLMIVIIVYSIGTIAYAFPFTVR